MIHLILGGARSGKSRFALQWCHDWATRQHPPGKVGTKHFVATATPFDDEMSQRIERHQQERGSDWLLDDVPLALAEYLSVAATATPSGVILVDCLTLWLNNQLYHDPGQDVSALRQALTTSLAPYASAHSSGAHGNDAGSQHDIDVVLVANEVGMGIVPVGDISRQFVDQAGWLNQAVAAMADRVTLVVAGLPLVLKDNHPEALS